MTIKVIEDWKPFRRLMTKKRREMLDKLTLKHGAHESPDDGVCVMEALAYVTGQKHSDHPVCVSRAITSYLIQVNDTVSEGDRQKLKELIPSIMHTAPVLRRVVEKQQFTGKIFRVVEEKTDATNSKYKQVEWERYNLISPILDDEKYTVEQALELVPKLVKMGKF